MILSYLGNAKELSTNELKDLLKTPNLNPTSRNIINIELISRKD